MLSVLFYGGLFGGLSLPGSSALQVTDLYRYQVAVANESDAERNRAFTEALTAVVLKVTGDRRHLQVPAIERALRNAQDYVEGISYSTELIEVIQEQEQNGSADDDGASGGVNSPQAGTQPASDNADGSSAADSAPLDQAPATEFSEQRYISVNFASSLIDELLVQANIPIWDSNRPSVLVWMILQDASGERSFLSAETNPEIIEIMQGFAISRGLPIIFPVLDFEDRRNLSEDIVWALDQQAIAAASERYGADSILAGRLHFTAGGELVGLWQFLFQQQAEVFDGFDEELISYINQPLERITNQLSSYFAIVPEAASEQVVSLRVDGVRNLTAYSALLTYVRGLAVVENVYASSLDGDRLDLQLDLLGDSRQLAELIDLDRDLLPISESSNLTGDINPALHYRWTR